MTTAAALRASLLTLAALWPNAAPADGRRPPKTLPAEPSLRTCPELGEGFLRLPGSDGCVRVSGSVRIEFARQGRGAAFIPDGR